MEIIEYSSEHFNLLREMAATAGPCCTLGHRSFVDYYYTNNEWSKLYLAIGENNDVLGALGIDIMRFEWKSEEIPIAFGNNFYSFQPGVGGFLFMRWIRTCPLAIVFGGSKDTHRLIKSQKWTFYSGVKTYQLNRVYETVDQDAWWRNMAMQGLNVLEQIRKKSISSLGRRIPRDILGEISVHREAEFSSDLFPAITPFDFRFAPTVPYLNWRYNTALSFVRYRLFRIERSGVVTGYVVLNESPEKIIVAHCDGADPETLAWGVVLSIVEVAQGKGDTRAILLTSTHPAMQKIFTTAGFHSAISERILAFGGLRKKAPMPPITANWLVNLDWGDNGLRMPFLD